MTTCFGNYTKGVVAASPVLYLNLTGWQRRNRNQERAVGMAGAPRGFRMARTAAGRRAAFVVLLSCLTLLVCPSSMGLAAEASVGTGDQASSGFALHNETPGVDNYLVGPGDLLEVRVMGEESISRTLSGQFLVEADGTLNYPVVGNLEVEGASIGQVARLIKETLDGIAPISGLPFVRVVEYAPVYIVGDIPRAGPYPFRPAMTVMQLVLRAGGLAKPADTSSRISGLKQEIVDLELVVFSLMAQRSRLLAELENQQFMGELPPDRPAASEGILTNETALFAAKRREKLSQFESYEAQKRTYEQEITSLERSITLHDEELELLKARYVSQESLADKGLAPKSQLIDARRELLGMERQGLEFRTALVRANQGRLAVEQRLGDVEIGTEVRNRLTLSEIELNLARNQSRLAGVRAALADLEQLPGPRSVLGPRAVYTILRGNGELFESIPAGESSVLQRGDILRVDFGSDELASQGPAAYMSAPPATMYWTAQPHTLSK